MVIFHCYVSSPEGNVCCYESPSMFETCFLVGPMADSRVWIPWMPQLSVDAMAMAEADAWIVQAMFFIV